MIVHEGHTDYVNSVAFSPDGKSVVSGSSDKTVRTWSAQSSSPIGEPLRGHGNAVQSVSYYPLGNLIASGSTDHTIRLWEPSTGQQLGDAFKGDHTFLSVASSPDAKLIASGSSGSSSPTGNVTSVAFSPCGQYVASGSNDSRVIIRRVLGEDPYPAVGDGVEPQIVTRRTEVGKGEDPDGDPEPGVITGQALIQGPYEDPDPNDDAEPQSVTQEVKKDDIKDGEPKPQMITSQVVTQEARKDPDSDNDVGPQIVTREMSTQQIFECLCRAGCVNLSSQMDTGQDTAMIASGGGFGDIWKGEMHTGAKVAIKAWRTTALKQCEYKTLKRAARELHLWSRMDHPHIHQLQGVILFKEQYLGMVSEWMDNGNLHDYLLKHPRANRYQLCIHVTSGLEYMHGRNTVHGDLKALNVLVSSEGIARLSDFDFSIMSDASSLVFTASSNNRMGSIRWVAPEMISGTLKRTTRTDVYALGMTMLEIFTGDVPYPELRQDFAVMNAVAQGILPPRPAKYLTADELGNCVWKLMSDCWSREPHERPSAVRVLEVLIDGVGKT
ncbi:unnamed protein product [Rhizoctonia solani]|uniref:Protein kinase domain-containing protein n=1 Tax=Rhizoctonia solani TaxID=456999 RepID=A0A8H3DYJ1_9AGAM|nr:unnamed protein product [Rhizoctonia solani]